MAGSSISEQKTGPLQANATLNRITDLLRRAGLMLWFTRFLRVFDGLSQSFWHPLKGSRPPFNPAIYLSTHHQRVLLYEDGTYLPEVGWEVFFAAELKEPQFFHIQYCRSTAFEADVLQSYLNCL